MYADKIRKENDAAGIIRTFSGKKVHPLRLKPKDICIEDIAHHLSLLCRYTGACPKFYSVAQHSVLVSRLMDDMTTDAQLAGLLHDSGEAYFNDLASPVKHDPRMQWYRDLEHAATRMILKKFKVDPLLLPATKSADNAIFVQERDTWWHGADHIDPWPPRAAEREFLRTFRQLSLEL